MPDFRKTIDESNYQPKYDTISTTGPNAQGQQETWTNPNQQLTQSSAQELAGLMGATLVPFQGGGGPYSQNKPQYQLDFSSAKGDELDASMVDNAYQRAPAHFNAQITDELARLRGPLPQGVEAKGDDRTLAEKGLDPFGNPIGTKPPGGGTTPPPAPYVPPPPNIPGPNWGTTSPPPNIPGPVVPVNPLPPATGVEPVPPTGTYQPGGYTTPPPAPTGMPPSLLLNNPQPQGGLPPSFATQPSLPPVKMPGLLSPNGVYQPPAYNKGKGLLNLGLRHPDGTPYSPEELAAFGKTGRPPQFNDKEPPYTDVY